MSAPHGAGFQFAIDRGGTFTDVFARCPDGRVRVLKLLSEDPKYDDAPTEGIRRVLRESGVAVPDRGPLDSSLVQWIRMGTTVATNALLQRRGERTVLLVTRGFRDLLHIGTQARPDIFDLEVSMPPPLYEAVIEVDERLIPVQPRCRLPGTERMERIRGRSGDEVLVQKPPDLEALRVELQRVWDQGVRSVAVLLLHSYTCPSHEAQVGSLAESLGFSHVSLSSSLSAMARAVPRGMTACADAYLSPSLRAYLRGFRGGFSDGLKDVPVLFMRSDGGLTPMAQFSGARAVLSGPAGGVVGYSRTAFRAEDPRPVIGFDMGGTSTDVSRFAGRFEHVYDGVTAGVSIQTPQLNIQTVAAGGGSRLFYRSGLFVVGPESAGADPGPACYRKGGPATVTDANLVLGRLLPQFFPRIFGPAEDEALSVGAARGALQGLAELLAADDPENTPRSLEEVAMGFVRVANEAMSRPIRALTEARGHAVGQHVLACFGGAGGQHACAIARTLGMDSVFIHKHSGVLSAFGLALADVVHEAQEPSALRYEPAAFDALDERIRVLSQQCCQALSEQGFHSSQIRTEPFLHLRYAGTDCALMCSAAGHPPTPNSCRSGDFGAAFAEQYLTEFGFTIPGRAVLVDDIRVRGVGSSGISEQSPHPTRGEPCGPEMVTRCYFEGGFLDTPVFLMERLGCEQRLPGPAIIIDRHSTIVVEPGCVAELTPQGDIRIAVGSTAPHVVGPDLDPVLLSLFSHRFMSIAEQMGRVLQRSAISTNVKERLDFSCAVFAAGGQLVSNAPHIPVHLGAMQDAVQFQIRSVGADLQPGDVLLSNHPIAGGSHLPDLTVITPVFYPDLPGPVFWVASRGHHADIGGLTPGSMPPHSKTLSEEGAVFISFYLVRAGVFQEEAVSEVLVRSGTRALRDNVADLRAQVAANHKGATLLRELVAAYGLSGVTAYMEHIRTNAERSVRALLRGAAQRWGAVLEAEDRMDDGTPICLRVTVDPEEGSAVFDFSGSGPEVYGNCNAPRAITLSALIYCLRCMVGHDIPLNQGCLAPVRVILPEGSILSPSPQAAVVGGNVLTSQRIVDVVLRAFGACAASQGCMNNVTFGDASIGYYETVAGGAGAGPHWEGRSGVHSHMTNTRITDPEILELRYPVVLRRFELRRGSGGSGRFRGGDGVRRELQFRTPLVLSVLSDRRVLQPYGMDGGAPGSRGVNLLQRCDGRTVSLGGRACLDVGPGDTFILLTPGGGGFGSAAPPGGAVGPGGTERRGASEYWGGDRAP